MSVATIVTGAAYVLTESDGTRSLTVYQNGSRKGRVRIPAHAVSGTEWATTAIEGLGFYVTGPWVASPVDANDIRAEVSFDPRDWR